jgi:hypothetical protein
MNDPHQTQRLIAKLLRKRTDKYEALTWLTEAPDPSKRNLAEWPHRESVGWIRDLYARGAQQVWAVGFDRNLPYESINALIITLPDDPARRASVFASANEQIQRQGFEPEEDHDQPHLYIWFD